MYRIVQKRNYLFALSLALLIPGMIAWAAWGLRLGIDFTGGSLMIVNIPSNPPVEDVRATISSLNLGDTLVQAQENESFVLRLPHLTNEQHQQTLAALAGAFPESSEQSYETIGPTIGSELKRQAIFALTLVLIAIILYITWAFRKVSRGPVPSWVYGLSALVALLHDVLMVVGIFAILGHFFRVDINSLFVTALLTVLGFSVHDTIVVFDRIRERLRINTAGSYENVVNESLNQTLVRSINTSMTTLIVLIALFLFGGESIKIFVLALIIGITSGTYSSIFVASPLLVLYDRWRQR